VPNKVRIVSRGRGGKLAKILFVQVLANISVVDYVPLFKWTLYSTLPGIVMYMVLSLLENDRF
jgi:hypothetical protein